MDSCIDFLQVSFHAFPDYHFSILLDKKSHYLTLQHPISTIKEKPSWIITGSISTKLLVIYYTCNLTRLRYYYRKLPAFTKVLFPCCVISYGCLRERVCFLHFKLTFWTIVFYFAKCMIQVSCKTGFVSPMSLWIQCPANKNSNQ